MAKNIQSLQLLRSNAVYADKATAITNLKKVVSQDGVAALARYYTDSEHTQVKTVVGYNYVPSGQTTASNWTIMDFDQQSIEAMQSEIDAIEGAVGLNGDGTHKSSGGHYTNSASTIAGEIAALDAKLFDAKKDASAVAGQVVTTVAQADGVVSETKANVKDLQLGGYQKSAETGAIASADTINTAFSKLENTIDSLDYNLPQNENKVVVSFEQTNGKISGVSANITSVKLSGLAEATDAEIAAADTLGEALGKLQGQINAMDKAADVVAGQVVTTVAEEDGKVTETKANVKDLQLGGYVKDTAATGAIASTDTINAALSKLENTVGANKITNADGSIVVTAPTGAATTTDIKVNIKSDEKVIKLGNDGIYTNLNLVKITTGLGATIKERYQLLASDDSQIGVNIDIAKDSHIVSITYITDSSSEHYQNLEYKYIDAEGTEQTEYVDISSLVLEAEFASGITVTDHVAHGVVDTASEKDGQATPQPFLTVGADGFKVDGIKNEITRQINLLDVTGDTAVAGQYVAAIEETDGIVAVKTRANVSEAVLNNYAKGSDTSAITTGDTVNAAFSKLEKRSDVLSGKTVTEIGSSNSSITATYSAATDDTRHYDLVTDASKIKMSGFTADTSGLTAITEASTVTEAVKAIETEILHNEETVAAALTELDADKIENINVNGVSGTVADNIASVTIGGANIELTSYAKGSDASAIAATDTVNAALGKLENQIGKAKDAATTKVVEGTDTGNNMVITPTTGADGSVTYTIDLSDVAKKSELDAEIAARKAVDGQSGSAYTANASATYISGATSLNDADVKLDAALKNVADNYISGVTVNTIGLTPTANKVAISVQAATSETIASGDNAITVDTAADGTITLGLATLDAGTF